jgi:hypothetical protein
MKYQLQNYKKYKNDHVIKDYTLNQPNRGTLCEPPYISAENLNKNLLKKLMAQILYNVYYQTQIRIKLINLILLIIICSNYNVYTLCTLVGWEKSCIIMTP